MAQKSKEVLSLQKRAGLLTENYEMENSYKEEGHPLEEIDMDSINKAAQLALSALGGTVTIASIGALINAIKTAYVKSKKSNNKDQIMGTLGNLGQDVKDSGVKI